MARCDRGLRMVPRRLLVAPAAGALLALLLPSAARESEAASPPTVVVKLASQPATTQLLGGLKPVKQQELRLRITEWVKTALAGKHPFVDWTTDPGAPGQPPPAWEWQVLVDEQPGTVTLPNGTRVSETLVQLRHFAGRPGSLSELPSAQPRLYDLNQLKPASGDTLIHDMQQLLEQQLTAGFHKAVEEAFLRKIPLGDRIVLDTGPTKRVIVPLRLCELHVGRESQLEVKFDEGSPVSTGEGWLYMETARAVEDGSYKGCVYGPVLLLDLPGHHITPGDYWHPLFETTLGSARNVRVFMHKYQPDTVDGDLTAGGIILDPGACGGVQ